MRGVRSKPKAGFRFNVQKQLMLKSSGGASLAKCFTWILALVVIRDAGSQLGVHIPVPLTLGRRETIGDGVPDVLQSTTSSPSSSLIVQVGTFPNILY